MNLRAGCCGLLRLESRIILLILNVLNWERARKVLQRVLINWFDCSEFTSSCLLHLNSTSRQNFSRCFRSEMLSLVWTAKPLSEIFIKRCDMFETSFETVASELRNNFKRSLLVCRSIPGSIHQTDSLIEKSPSNNPLAANPRNLIAFTRAVSRMNTQPSSVPLFVNKTLERKGCLDGCDFPAKKSSWKEIYVIERQKRQKRAREIRNKYSAFFFNNVKVIYY